MFGANDITWCASNCDIKSCFRNPINMKDKIGIHSFADFKGTRDCTFINSDKKVTIQERGWAGHFIGSHRCKFRRNTLITCEDIKLIVSTVGCYIQETDCPPFYKKGEIGTIGYNRWYETMVFESLYDEYDDANVKKQIMTESDWGIWGETWDKVEEKYGKEVDIAANNMHENIVKEMSIKIKEMSRNVKASNIV